MKYVALSTSFPFRHLSSLTFFLPLPIFFC